MTGGKWWRKKYFQGFEFNPSDHCFKLYID